MQRVARIVSAIWLGAGVFLLLITSAVFRAASNPVVAANVVGAILTRWHYVALLCPAVLIVLEYRRARTFMLAALLAGITLAAAEGLLDVQIRHLRAASIVPISSLAPDDPARRHFGMMHGLSALLLIGQVIAAAGHEWLSENREPDPDSPM